MPAKKAATKNSKKKTEEEDEDVTMASDSEGEVAYEEYSKGKNAPVEEVYQKLTQLEHILKRPDTYVGSTEATEQTVWVYDFKDSTPKMALKKITYVPALYKIFDEILVNAADNRVRDETMDKIKVDIDQEKNEISVWNNGKGIPVEMHKEHNMYVPTLIFGHLLTGSSFDDSEKKIIGGRNGYGAKLTNIFSTEFEVETIDSKNQKKFRQVWRNNMQKTDEPKITKNTSSEDYTMVKFKPDLSKFNMTSLDDDIVSLFMKRVYDIAGTTGGKIGVYLNKKKIPIKSFKDYVKTLTDTVPNSDVIYEEVSDRWQIAVAPSDGSFQQVSFVNTVATIKGGKHVSHVADQVIKNMEEYFKKKHKSSTITKAHIKNHLFIFVNALIINPTFDSQSKEALTLNVTKFGSKCTVSEEFMKKVYKSSIVEGILEFAKAKEATQLKKAGGSKKARLTGIAKLDDANDAGTRNSEKCTLILTEGDSAKALAVSGLSVVGRDNYGVFPLKGKPLNVRDVAVSRMTANEEISNITKILGLQHKTAYDKESIKKLRYGSVMIMADQDHDGSHIKGLLINWLHTYWPSLLKVPGFVKEFITPIVKVTNKRTKQSKSFFTIPEYEKWKQGIIDASASREQGLKQWTIKYYKGLGTSTAAEAKEYFSNIKTHQVRFDYEGEKADDKIIMAFAKEKVNDRKEWINTYKEGVYLDHSKQKVTYSDFIDKELILFSIEDNMRSIPSVVDGLKPGQRKILYCCFKRNLKQEIKVAQLSGYVSEHSAYHHGEQSLHATIVKMAQDFVGSNNINLLYPGGQFGTRIQGGEDHASARYIFTKLSDITRSIFHEDDDKVLEYLDDDGQLIEPKFYVPVIPMVLVNGAEGIGSGYSTNIPTYNPRDIVANIRKMLDGDEPSEMVPYFKGFKGEIEYKGGKYITKGKIEQVDDTTVVITELPAQVWTQKYKEKLVKMMGETVTKDKEKKDKKEKKDAKEKEDTVPFIEDFRENHTDTDVHFTVFLTPEKMKEALEEGLEKKFKLTSSIATTNMVLFTEDGKLKKYNDTTEILKDFFSVRKVHYEKRKTYIIEKLKREFDILDNKVRFILAVVNEELVVRKKKKADLLKELQKKGFKAYPKESPLKTKAVTSAEEEREETDSKNETENEEDDLQASAYNYLLSLPLWSLTIERVKDLERQKEEKYRQLKEIESMTIEDMWRNDLSAFESHLEEVESKEEKSKSKTKALHKSTNSTTKKGANRKTTTKKAKDEKPTKAKKSKAKKEESEDEADFDEDEPMVLDEEDDEEEEAVEAPKPSTSRSKVSAVKKDEEQPDSNSAKPAQESKEASPTAISSVGASLMSRLKQKTGIDANSLLKASPTASPTPASSKAKKTEKVASKPTEEKKKRGRPKKEEKEVSETEMDPKSPSSSPAVVSKKRKLNPSNNRTITSYFSPKKSDDESKATKATVLDSDSDDENDDTVEDLIVAPRTTSRRQASAKSKVIEESDVSLLENSDDEYHQDSDDE